MPTIPGTLKQHRTYIYTVLFLFFIQLITEFIEAVYVFGLLGTSIPNEIVSVLFFFSPLVVVIFGRRLTGNGLIILGELVLISRLLDPLLDTRGRMLVSGFGVACFLIFLPLLLWRLSRQGGSAPQRDLGTALMLALALSVLLRAWNSGSDLSLQGWGQLIGWVLIVSAGVLLPGAFRSRTPADLAAPDRRTQGFGRLSGLCIGVLAVFILLHFALSSPNVIARWTGTSYIAILGTLALAMCLSALIVLVKPGWLSRLSKNVIVIWNASFLVALALTILPHQLNFPADPTGYPFYEPQASALSFLPLYLMLLLSPIVMIDFSLYTREIILMRPNLRRLGGGFLVASTIYLLLVLAHVFTTVYDYIPVIGPFFRDRFWLVYLAAGTALAFPTLLVRQPVEPDRESRAGATALLIGIYAAAFIGGLLVPNLPIPVVSPGDRLRLLTYNVQQGYSADGSRNFDGQLELIRSVDPDIIGLQESDTDRIAGGNADLVRYFADRLGMHAYYGPKTTTGTFGIALLSKLPIENPRTFFMYSQGEQTATIAAQVRYGDEPLNIFVTHLGNSGSIVQQEAILEEIDGMEPVIAIGDFNFRPDSGQYQLTTRLLQDAWLLKWPQGADDQGFNPAERIDHMFVSPGVKVTNARFLTEPESDHPALLVDIAR